MRAAVTISPRAGQGTAVGTCGELLQGVLPGGRRFHVTCPIALGVTMTVRLHTSTATSVTGLPAWATTTTSALVRAAELLELGPVRIEVERRSALDRAKGLASSTADLVAAVRGLAAAAGCALDAPTLAELATSVEASDGVMYDGIVAFDQHHGGLLRQWSWSPGFAVAMFVPGEERITAEVRFAGQDALAPQYAAMFEALDAAMVARDAGAVARLAMQSAELNEAFAPNPLLPGLRDAVGASGAAGLCVGHSGTVCGLLFSDGPAAGLRAQAAVDQLLPALPPGTRAHVTRMPR